MRQLRRAGVLVVIGAGVVWLLALGGGQGLASLLFGWGVLGYLVWRALPALKSDLAAVLALRPRRAARARRGDYL